MDIHRPWAFWRRVQYLSGFATFFLMIGVGSYFLWYYTPATCFDGSQSDGELGVDCGGVCQKLCLFQVTQPTVLWSRSFEIAPGQYNAVAYVENTNLNAGAPEIRYSMKLYDEAGVITERIGTTVLPPDSVYPIFEGRIFTQDRRPIRTELVIEETEPWFPAEQGREQFAIGNRELKSADLSPRLEVDITNNDLIEARDIEVVATIFDRNGNALTASQTVVPQLEGRTSENIIFTWPRPIAKTIRSCSIPTDVLIAIDLSGSMNDDGDTPPEPITSVLASAQAFVDRLKNDADQAGVITFATESTVHTPLTTNKTLVRGSIGDLVIPPAEESGFTNTGDAFVRAAEEFASNRHSEDARKVLVLLTDGLATAPEENPDGHATSSATALKAQDVEVFTIGLGERVNSEFLTGLASAPENYQQALSIADIDRIYTSITAAICEDGAAVIDVIPKSDAAFR